MSKVTVTICPRFGVEKTYDCKVSIGGMMIMTDIYIFPDDHPHPSSPSKTVLEDHEERLAKNPRDYYPMKYNEPISTIEQAVAVAAGIISDNCNDEDLRVYEQPKYVIHQDWRNRFTDVSEQDTKSRSYIKSDIEIVTFVETDSKPRKDDRITIEKGIAKFPMLIVVQKDNELGIKTTDLPLDTQKDFLTLKELEEKGYIVSDIRTIEIKVDKYRSYIPPKKEMTWGRAPKSGTVSSIYEAHENIRKIYEYFDGRRLRGDIFLDQNLADTHRSSKAALDAIEKLIEDMEAF